MIKGYKKIIDETLQGYFDDIINSQKYAKNCAMAMKYTTCLNGKRLRAVLCLEACNFFSNDYFAAIPTACAFEMLHAQSLIHDDLPAMDNDDLRRGKPSNHKVYGEAIAILAGDGLISLGGQLIIEKTPKTVPLKNVVSALNLYLKAAGIFGIVAGQTADLNASKHIQDENCLEYIQKYKTGALFEAAVLSGAIIAGADSGKIEILRNFANCFGIAFQMADDILDVISTAAILGKTTGKDEYENKLTCVKKYGLDAAKQKLRSQIEKTCDILKDNSIDSEVFYDLTNGIVKGIF